MSENNLPARLKAAREKLGITMAEASRRLNMSKIGYCRYEYGERTPSLQTIEVIAQCFGTSVDYLLGNTDDMSPNCFVIQKEKSPELFEFIKQINSMDPSEQNHLFTYYKNLI